MERVLILSVAARTFGVAGIVALLFLATAIQSHGAECTGATYNSTAFQEETSHFSPHERVYLIVSCTGLIPGDHTMHINWVHSKQGIVRSDKHEFGTESAEKRGIYFWFRLSRKGPMASMLSNQDFYEQNFGEWSAETYLDDELVLTRSFTISDGVQ